LAEQTAAVGINELHPPELRAVDAREAVVPGEPLVDEGVVRAQKLQSAAVFAQNISEEQLGLLAKSLADVVVEIGEHQQVGNDLCLQIAQLQPLAREIFDQGAGAFIRKHARHLPGEHARRAQPPRGCQIQQFLIGDAAPQEERQARGQLDVADRMRDAGGRARRIFLNSIQKVRAR